MDASPRSADEILALLRAHGDRVTASRRAVVDALVAGDHHVTADEIVARVAAGDGPDGGDPEAHRATVYRTLDRLEELGVISHVHLGHGPSTFHLDAFDALAAELRTSRGFVLSPQHFALSGVCRDCA